MVLLTVPSLELNIPQSAVSLSEKDPRATTTSEFLDSLRGYTLENLSELRVAQIRALGTEFARLERDLERLERLPNGWDGYDADGPSRTSIDGAKELLRAFQQALITPQRIGASA